MKLIFLTDGPGRLVRIGQQVIQLRHTTPRNMATTGRVSGLVIQALRHLGRAQMGDSLIDQLRSRLTDDDKAQLLKDLPFAPVWMVSWLQRLAKSPIAP
jgi:hypothetical protein